MEKFQKKSRSNPDSINKVPLTSHQKCIFVNIKETETFTKFLLAFHLIDFMATGDGPFTVFAPVNDAFDAVNNPDEKLVGKW